MYTFTFHALKLIIKIDTLQRPTKLHLSDELAKLAQQIQNYNSISRHYIQSLVDARRISARSGMSQYDGVRQANP